MDRRTIEIYDREAGRYADQFERKAPDASLRAFMARLAPGARVLDLGCGPGMASAHLAAAGFDPDPVDASAEMVRLARERHGLPARQATFDDPIAEGAYGGVWANFSLLHAPRADLPGLIGRLASALAPGGVLHLGLKTGTGEKRDHLGRLYTFVTRDELAGWLAEAGLVLVAERTGEERGLAGTLDPFILVLAEKPDA